MDTSIQLIVGLGNPGIDYEHTRHNAGADFVTELARCHGEQLTPESKFFGLTGRLYLNGRDIRLLIPTTFMNRSGQAVAAMANFFKIDTNTILVAHDELDIEPGTARLKSGGGHGGHNGLRDIVSSLGNDKNFSRLRIGIGHPGSSNKVAGYVLKKAAQADQDIITAAIDEAVRVMPEVVSGKGQIAMNKLHSFKA